MPTEYYFPDEDVYQKAVFWNELFSSSPGSEGSSICSSSSSSNNSLSSEDMNGGPLAKIPKTSHNLDFNNGHKKLNRSQSEPRRYRHNNGTTSNKYKTELCHTYTESGGKNCKYGEKCQYAHGEEELRVVARHPKYKTELCKTFHASEDAICPYGHRCHFIHRTPLTITNANAAFYVMPNGMMSACSSLRDLTISPYGTSPTSSVFSFDGSMSPFMDNFSSMNSPPPSPIEARLPVFDKLASLPFGGLTA